MLCVMGFFAILSSTMSKSPVLKTFASSLGTPADLTGFVASASTIPGILVSLPAASLSDIYGRRKFLLAAGLVFASAPFLYLLITTWWQLVLVRFYHGFATAIFVPVAEASVAEAFPARRGERISLFSSATYVGRVIAPTLGGYILFVSSSNFHLLYLAVGTAGGTSLIMALPFLAERRQTQAPRERKTSEIVRTMFSGWRTVAQSRGVMLVGLVQASEFFVYGSVEFFLAGYLLETVRLDDLSTGLIITSIIGVGIFARPYMGRLSDKIGRRVPIVLGLTASAVPLFAIPFSANFWILLLLVAVYGLGFAAVMGSTPALTSELVPKQLVGSSMGFLDTIMDAGQTLGPIVSGFILGTSIQYGLHYTLVFPFLGVVLLTAGFVFLLEISTTNP